MTVGVWRWVEIHIHTSLCVLPVDQTPVVRQARLMKKLAFVCEVSAGLRAATARALRPKSRIDGVNARFRKLTERTLLSYTLS